MPLWIILGLVVFLLFLVLGWYYEQKQKSGKEDEENTLRIIKNFLKNNNYHKSGYLLINNLILQKPYWSCEIDILLLTRKWIYVIEVKDWQVGTLKGNYNDEYLKLFWKVGNRGWKESKKVYSSFYQNETHIKRLRNYFYLSKPNILSIIVFNSSNLGYNFKRDKNLFLKEKFTLANNGIGGGIADILTKYERQNTWLTSFEKLREKIIQENMVSGKVQKHLNWSRSVRKGKEF